MADSAAPTADDKARYEALKKELMQALPKKRAIDKQLVSVRTFSYNVEADGSLRPRLRFRFTTSKLHTLQRQLPTVVATSFKALRTISKTKLVVVGNTKFTIMTASFRTVV